MTEAITLESVFKVGGVPTYTFVEPVEYNQLIVALRTPGRGIVVEGPSGIGKTTALMRAINAVELGDKVLVLSGRRPSDLDLINELPSIRDAGIVLIDDFHRLSNDIKQKIADHLKILADEENTKSKIIVLGINQAGKTLIEFANDLNNRLEVIRFEANPDSKIQLLLDKGQQSLNITFNIIDDIVDASNGSFYVAQMLAHQICIDQGVLEARVENTPINVSFEETRSKVYEKLERAFYDKAKSFCQGTRVRKEGRAPYLHLLYWLATSKDWVISMDNIIRSYPEHRGSVGQVADKGYLKDLIENNDQLSSVLHYDSVSRNLTVEDPQFMFFVRNIPWQKFATEIGFDSIYFKSIYDFALSFAGEDREIAKQIFDKLTEQELHVFYDKNEQHRILAQDVEDYLRPIYQSDAEFIIALLSKNYPKKLWTKFESDHFKQRFKNNAVVPIWFSDAPTGLFDESKRYGGITLYVDNDIESQVDEIIEVLKKTITEKRQTNS